MFPPVFIKVTWVHDLKSHMILDLLLQQLPCLSPFSLPEGQPFPIFFQLVLLIFIFAYPNDGLKLLLLGQLSFGHFLMTSP